MTLRTLKMILLTGALALSAVRSGLAETPVDLKEVEARLRAHDRAVRLTTGWVRDPYIYLAPDGFYYLTGTMPAAQDERQKTTPYNTGLGPESIVGDDLRVWRSQDLAHWESMGAIYNWRDTYLYTQAKEKQEKEKQAGTTKGWAIWAPELHFYDGHWFIVHTSPHGPVGSNLAITAGPKLERPYTLPMGENFLQKHDPSLIQDDDKRIWAIWAATKIAPLKPDFSGFAEPERDIAPSNRKIGHEGCTILKVGKRYVLFGTGWSTDQSRKGTYNLYYCTASVVTGPYGPRLFFGRFLGHGTPFQDKEGRWWCTAFYNSNVPPITREEARNRSLADDAYTINEQGVSIVPLTCETLSDGDVRFHALDPDYAKPGLEEVQKFEE